MPQQFHAVVCIDHAGAIIFDFTKDDFTEHRIEAEAGPGNIHHKAGSAGSGHTHDAKSYFAAVAAQLQPSHEILIVGHKKVEEMRTYWLSVHLDSRNLPNIRAVIDFLVEIVRDKRALF